MSQPAPVSSPQPATPSDTPLWVGRTLRVVPQEAGEVPAEQAGRVAVGVAVHLGPTALYGVGLVLTGLTVAHAVIGLLLTAGLHFLLVRGLERAWPSVALPEPSPSERRTGLAFVALTGVGAGSLVVLAAWNLVGAVVPNLGLAGSWWAIAGVVLATDFVYYLTHRFLCHGRGAHPVVRWWRRNHHTHHAVEHLDFLRGNVSSFLDTAVTGFQVPVGILGALAGLDGASLAAAYSLVLMLQATHHLNHTLNLGPLRFVFMDNHAHKLHHCPMGMLVNHGALFSLWDLAFGTYYEDASLRANHLHRHGMRLPLRPAA